MPPTLLQLLSAGAAAQTPLTADTLAGPVVGRRLHHNNRSIDEFLGVPYDAPPIGERRWRPPQPLSPWTAPRPAT